MGGGCIHPVGGPESLDQPRKRPERAREARAIEEDGGREEESGER